MCVHKSNPPTPFPYAEKGFLSSMEAPLAWAREYLATHTCDEAILAVIHSRRCCRERCYDHDGYSIRQHTRRSQRVDALHMHFLEIWYLVKRKIRVVMSPSNERLADEWSALSPHEEDLFRFILCRRLLAERRLPIWGSRFRRQDDRRVLVAVFLVLVDWSGGIIRASCLATLCHVGKSQVPVVCIWIICPPSLCTAPYRGSCFPDVLFERCDFLIFPDALDRLRMRPCGSDLALGLSLSVLCDATN